MSTSSAAYELPTMSMMQPTMGVMQPERAHQATTIQSAHNVSKAGHMYEASKKRARAADMHKLSSVRPAHDERDAAKESASGKHNVIGTQGEQGTLHACAIAAVRRKGGGQAWAQQRTPCS